MLLRFRIQCLMIHFFSLSLFFYVSTTMFENKIIIVIIKVSALFHKKKANVFAGSGKKTNIGNMKCGKLETYIKNFEKALTISV
jgi:hypothetical protein